MKALFLLLLSLLRASHGARYAFYNQMNHSKLEDGTRRVFGGMEMNLADFPNVCLFTSKDWYPRCSGAIVALRWALTAAHCVESHLYYIKYNSNTPRKGGDATTIERLFKHPEYNVVQLDEGRGMDVTQLHNDVGLVKASRDMVLNTPVPKPLEKSLLLSPEKFMKADVMALGFGRTESEGSLGDQLFAVNLRGAPCERLFWYHCLCGRAREGSSARGVCSGDSGGPVLLNGTQIGVTSMGPIDCVNVVDADPRSTSVFTLLYHYIPLLNATIYELTAAGDEMAMQSVPLDAGNRLGSMRLFLVIVALVVLFIE